MCQSIFSISVSKLLHSSLPTYIALAATLHVATWAIYTEISGPTASQPTHLHMALTITYSVRSPYKMHFQALYSNPSLSFHKIPP